MGKFGGWGFCLLDVSAGTYCRRVLRWVWWTKEIEEEEEIVEGGVAVRDKRK